MLRVAATVASAVAVSLLLPPLVLATEKVQGNMEVPATATYSRDTCGAGYIPVPPSAAFIAGKSTAKFKIDNKCRTQITLSKMSGLPLGDGMPGTGDEVICVVNEQTPVPAVGANICETYTLRGEVVGSATSETVKLGWNPTLTGVCPDAPGTHHPQSIECYEPSPGYSASGACAALGGSFIASGADPTQGWCRAATYVANPTTPVLAIQGVLF